MVKILKNPSVDKKTDKKARQAVKDAKKQEVKEPESNITYEPIIEKKEDTFEEQFNKDKKIQERIAILKYKVEGLIYDFIQETHGYLPLIEINYMPWLKHSPGIITDVTVKFFNHAFPFHAEASEKITYIHVEDSPMPEVK